jgi:hypothetical protein
MAQGKKSWAPASHPVRTPTNTQQEIGRIVNPPRGVKLGGPGEGSLFDSEQKQKGTAGPNGKGPVSDRGRGGRK